MTLEQRIIALGNAIGADVKALKAADGDLTALTTTAKGNLVAAINEINAALATSGVQIDDTATDGATTVTWSVDKIFDTIEAAKQSVKDDLSNGAASALDTFKELEDALGGDANFAATVATSLSNKVDYSTAQTLTVAQKLQACNNIGVGDPDHDFVTDYTTARDS